MAEEQDPEVPDVPEHDLSEVDMMFVSLLYNYILALEVEERGEEQQRQGAFPTGLCLSFSGSSLLHLYLSLVPSLFNTFSRSRYFWNNAMRGQVAALFIGMETKQGYRRRAWKSVREREEACQA